MNHVSSQMQPICDVEQVSLEFVEKYDHKKSTQTVCSHNVHSIDPYFHA